MTTSRVGMLQLRIDATDPVAARIERTLAWAREAAVGVDLLVLPELWHVGAFDVEGARQYAEPIDGELVSSLSDVARNSSTWLHGGSFAEVTVDGRYFNTSVVFAPDGSLAAVYRKIHLFGFTGGETVLMSAGQELVTLETPVGCTGLATCYDLRFPEIFRALVDRGAVALLLASGWPSTRIAHWTALARARAIENQAVVIACNEVGFHADTTLGGRSIIVNAMGDVLAEGGTDEEFITAEIDGDLTLRWREQFPALNDRVL